MAAVPFGPLVNFGNYASGLAFPNTSSPVIKSEPPWTAVFENITSQRWPIDLNGFSKSSFKEAVMQWDYPCLAAIGQSGAVAAAAVQSQFDTIWNWFDGSYSLTDGYTVAGCSGEVGWLTVKTADLSATRRCFARMMPPPAQLQGGRNTMIYKVRLSWVQLTDWA